MQSHGFNAASECMASHIKGFKNMTLYINIKLLNLKGFKNMTLYINIKLLNYFHKRRVSVFPFQINRQLSIFPCFSLV